MTLEYHEIHRLNINSFLNQGCPPRCHCGCLNSPMRRSRKQDPLSVMYQQPTMWLKKCNNFITPMAHIFKSVSSILCKGHAGYIIPSCSQSVLCQCVEYHFCESGIYWKRALIGIELHTKKLKGECWRNKEWPATCKQNTIPWPTTKQISVKFVPSRWLR